MTREELNQKKQKEIYNEQRYEKRKNTTIFIFKFCLFLVICFLAFYFYTEFVSSKIISVKEKRIINEKLPSNFNGLKIIQFSDLHYGTTIFEDEVKKLVKQINERNADLVVFTGDLIDKSYVLSLSEQKLLTEQLKNIKASLGKYAIIGEEDNNEIFSTIMIQSDFEVLNNSYDFIYKDINSPILLIGLSNSSNDQIDINKGFAYFSDTAHNTDIFSITLIHEPDNTDFILNLHSTDLILAGHSHNGSIRLPFIGGLYNLDGAKKYNDPYYKISNTDLFISSGIGTNGVGFRLFCRPSINFFRISNK